jgi:hydroxymethylglutaryl-CoA lyase
MNHTCASTAAAPPSRVVLRDVALRDGLQSLGLTMPTVHKMAWLDLLYTAGLREVEVGSFVPARLLPQLADTAEVLAHAQRLPGLVASVLVPNARGAERALALGSHALLMPLSASRAHSLANLRKPPEAALAELADVRRLRDAAGSACLIEVGIATAFGCTLQGEVPAEDVLALVRAALDAGAERVGLADTVGFADPLAVARLCEATRAIAGERFDCAHFHDTRGLALANAVAAWQTGVRRIDASHAGLGGCPHAPGASGNVAAEDLAFAFERMGVATGVSVEALLAARQPLAQCLPGVPLQGHLWRAGLPRVQVQQPVPGVAVEQAA